VKKFVSIILLLPLFQTVLGQSNEANIWVFGKSVLLNFNTTGPPTVDFNSIILTQEGCASIANPDGQLMFYTDGRYVFNQVHDTMDNGKGLKGDFGSTQSAIIVPKPQEPNIYYVFTVPELGNPVGLNYSVVDMSYNGGLGKVTQKNVFLTTPVTEKVTAMKHANNEDVWVITHKWRTFQVWGGDTAFYPSDTILAYLVTSQGVSPTPVISTVGAKLGGYMHNTVGYLKGSPGGDKLAMAVFYSNFYQMFDFNAETGIVSNPITFPGFYRGYGLEFSPNSRYLYVSEQDPQASDTMYISQFDLYAGDTNAIKNSKVRVGTTTNEAAIGRGALQVAPDQKIYITRAEMPRMAVINNPNLKGVECGFVSDGLIWNSISAHICKYGLPTFIQSYFSPPTFEAHHICHGDQTEFVITSDITGYLSLLWEFGDGGTSTLPNPTHQYATPGQYIVTLTVTYEATERTAEEVLIILTKPTANFNYQQYCFGSPTQFNDLSVSNGGIITGWQWDFGDGTATIKNPQHTFTSPGLHNVDLIVTTDNGCVSEVKTLPVNQIPPPYVSPMPTGPTVMCENSSNSTYSTTGANDATSYLWIVTPAGAGSITGTTKTAIMDWNDTFSGTASITVTSINQCQEPSNPSPPLQVTINALPEVYAGQDADILYNTDYTIADATVSGTTPFDFDWTPVQYLLNSTIKNPTTVLLQAPVLFTFKVTDGNNCIDSDQVLVDVYGGPLGASIMADDDTICKFDQTQLHAVAYGGSEDYQYTWTCNPNPNGWSSNIDNPIVHPEVTTTYDLLVFDGFNTITASHEIAVWDLPEADAGDPFTIPWGSPAQLDGSAQGGAGPPYSYHWNPSTLMDNPYMPNPTTHNLYNSTTFYFEVEDRFGCTNTDYVSVTISGGPISALPSAIDSAICFGTTTKLFSNPGGGSGIYTSYSWEPHDLVVNSSGDTTLTMPLYETTTFTITVVDNNGNDAQGQLTIVVNPLPVINLKPENGTIINDSMVSVCVFDTIVLRPFTGPEKVSYLWNNGSDADTMQIQTSGVGWDVQKLCVTVTFEETGCVKSDTVYILFTYDECVGIEDPDSHSYMVIYPNPTKGYVNMATRGLNGRYIFEMSDLRGMVVYRKEMAIEPESSQIIEFDLSGLPDGLYIIKLTGENKLFITKLILQ
jgi:PKD repeat protein